MKDLLITPRLSRAARALLDWQQSDLAASTGLSISAIKDFESGGEKSRHATIQTIQDTFETHGVEFPSSGGVRNVDEIASIVRFVGPSFIEKWNEDIYQSCTDPRQPIRTSSAGESLWTTPSIKQTNDAYLAWAEHLGITHKVLTPQGQKAYNMPHKMYRTLPLEMLGKITYSLYADRLAFILWKKRQIIVIRNAQIVETFRNQFEYLWKLGKSVAE